jgi:hypothetical protein
VLLSILIAAGILAYYCRQQWWEQHLGYLGAPNDVLVNAILYF